jgi:hypothetical protein
MKMLSLIFSFFALNAYADTFICNTPGLGAGYRIEIQTIFNQPIAHFKVVKWSSAPPPAFGEKVILRGQGDLVILQKIPRAEIKAKQEDYTKWIISSPDLSLNFVHYGVANAFGKVGKVGSGLPGEFNLNKMKVAGRIECLRKK